MFLYLSISLSIYLSKGTQSQGVKSISDQRLCVWHGTQHVQQTFRMIPSRDVYAYRLESLFTACRKGIVSLGARKPKLVFP